MTAYLFYVVLQRFYWGEDCVNFFDREEAIKSNWIDEAGNRVWVAPPAEETTTTFVWGFNDLDSAIAFYDVLSKNELGIKCVPD